LETQRCSLIRLNDNDYEDLKMIYINENVRKYLGEAIPEEHTYNKFLNTLQRSDQGAHYWTVRLKALKLYWISFFR
jgi:[ribosomal protein S5]-alanine N-acetyltransferase